MRNKIALRLCSANKSSELRKNLRCRIVERQSWNMGKKSRKESLQLLLKTHFPGAGDANNVSSDKLIVF